MLFINKTAPVISSAAGQGSVDFQISGFDHSRRCSNDPSARLAVAKDHQRLTKIADYIREVDPNDEDFYWIGNYFRKSYSIQITNNCFICSCIVTNFGAEVAQIIIL